MFLAETSEPNTPQQPTVAEVITEGDIERQLQSARQLVQDENYEDALSSYLFVFDYSRGLPKYNGARLSTIPSEIAQLGQTYPPAIVALRQRRDANEKLIFTGKGGYAQTQEIMSLNRYLEGEERNLAFFDRVSDSPTVAPELRDKIVSFVWKQLADAKRYSELESRIVKLARRVAAKISEFQLAMDFPGNDIEASPEYLDYLRQSIFKDGGRAYEVLLGVGKDEIAQKLVERLLSYQLSGHMFVTLIDHAIKAGRYGAARELFERGSQELTDPYDQAILVATEERIPLGDAESAPLFQEETPVLSFNPI